MSRKCPWQARDSNRPSQDTVSGDFVWRLFGCDSDILNRNMPDTKGIKKGF